MNRREFFKGSAWVFALAALAPVVEKGGVARHHLAATMRGDEVVFYLDGEVVPEESLRGNRPMQWIHGGVVWDCVLGKSDMRWLTAGINPRLICTSRIIAETPLSAPFHPFSDVTDRHGYAIHNATFSLFASSKFPDSLDECFMQYRTMDWVKRTGHGEGQTSYWMNKCEGVVQDRWGLSDKIDNAVINGINLCQECDGHGPCWIGRRA